MNTRVLANGKRRVTLTLEDNERVLVVTDKKHYSLSGILPGNIATADELDIREVVWCVCILKSGKRYKL